MSFKIDKARGQIFKCQKYGLSKEYCRKIFERPKKTEEIHRLQLCWWMAQRNYVLLNVEIVIIMNNYILDDYVIV